MAGNFPTRVGALRLRSLAFATLAAMAFVTSADASPRGYGIERLLGQDMPNWRLGPTAAPAPVARPQDRPPAVPAPAIAPPAPDPAIVAPPPPPPAAALREAAPAGARVIRKPGRPRSTVSGAWGAAN